MDTATTIIALVTGVGLLATLGLFYAGCTRRIQITRDPASPFSHGCGLLCLAALVCAATCLGIAMLEGMIALGDNIAAACGSWLGPCSAAYQRQSGLQTKFLDVILGAGAVFVAIAVCAALVGARKGLARGSGQ